MYHMYRNTGGPLAGEGTNSSRVKLLIGVLVDWLLIRLLGWLSGCLGKLVSTQAL